MKYEFFIGLRYLSSRRKQKFTSIIGIISVLGVIIGVMALNVVLAVMGGFEEELREKILGVSSHLVVLSYDGPMKDYDEIKEDVLEFPGVVGASPFIYGQGMIASERNVSGSVIRGIDPNTAGKVTSIEEAIGNGSVEKRKSDKKLNDEQLKEIGNKVLVKLSADTDSGKPPILIGKELAANLGVLEGDLVSLISPFGKLGPFGQTAKVKKYEVIGIFDYGMIEYDSSISYIDLGDAMDFFDMKGQVSGVEIKVQDIYNARKMGSELTSILGFPYYTRNWEEVNKRLFKALRLERIAIAIILGLIVLVAALNIVSTLTMVVMEKGKDIAILRAMGATKSGILKIFVTEGMIIGTVGTLLGTAAGYGICYLLKTSDTIRELIPFDNNVYPISDFPVKIEPFYFITVAFFSILICFIATLYPSFQASRKDPIEALRYE
ncbi:MAG: FtsX-like permease family protein [Candidatus Dadabacteria bacterium]|nr:FtsX-like permease family protein [Candidatus Dadabacteria bacterium]MCZ6791167.1 FtsX-like permease family protein [Candidatus Dadabacteria bacterium]